MDQSLRATLSTAWEAAEDFFRRRDELTRRTEAFRAALFDSTLPPEVIESVSATASILHTPTCLQLEDGTFYGFEGCCMDRVTGRGEEG